MSQEDLWNDLYSGNDRAWRGCSDIPDPCNGEGRALDLGCGNGKTVVTLLSFGHEVSGVDFSSVAIDSCRSLFAGRADFQVADLRSLPYADGTFSYVTAVHVMEHLEDDALREAASEIFRVSAPGAHVFIRSFTERDMRSAKRSQGGITYRFHTEEGFREAFRMFECVYTRLVEEPTRFGTLRSRVECMFRRP